VNGRCEFVMSEEQDRGYRAGELSAGEAHELSAESAWNHLPILDGYEDPDCFFGQYELVADGTHQMLFHCQGSDPYAEHGAIFDWFTRLRPLGRLLTGPVRVLTQRQDAPDGAVVSDWPLSVHPSLALAPPDGASANGLRFEDASDTALLRGLRARSDIDPAHHPHAVRVRVPSESDVYLAWIRGEIPDGMQEAVEAAWAAIRW
jgi:hypothetical protein